MKTGQVIQKSAVEKGELELINSYARRQLTEDEVYVFTVALCDNEIDRDFERFTVDSLEELSKLFVGKSGVFDHNPIAQNQSARIISCKTERVDGKKNSLGEDYYRMTARAYMPVTDGNAELRELIDSGIVREVSVGCAVRSTVCSICGKALYSPGCGHTAGETYGGKLCFGELREPFDAYEWSFVAVPAQKNAGVIKSYHERKVAVTDIIKSIETGKATELREQDCRQLKSYIGELKYKAEIGDMYRNTLVRDIMRLSAVSQPEISRNTMKSITDNLSVPELEELKKAYSKRFDETVIPKPQLFTEKNEVKTDNREFRI